MLTEAIKKIQDEIEKNKNEFTEVVGAFLVQHLKENEADSEKILRVDKTIANSFKEIEKVAKTKRKGNSALIGPKEGFEIVMKYFGIEVEFSQSILMNSSVATVNNVEPVQGVKNSKVSEFDFKLEDFM